MPCIRGFATVRLVGTTTSEVPEEVPGSPAADVDDGPVRVVEEVVGEVSRFRAAPGLDFFLKNGTAGESFVIFDDIGVRGNSRQTL